MDDHMKEVYFNYYCPRCKNWDTPEEEDPCYECLQEGGREESHRPVHYTSKDKKEH